MKFLTFAALLLVSAQAIRFYDEDNEPQSAAQAVGMRDGDLLSDQVDNFMEQAKNTVKESHLTKDRNAAFERVKAQSPTHSVNFLEVPVKQKPLLDRDFKLPEMQN